MKNLVKAPAIFSLLISCAPPALVQPAFAYEAAAPAQAPEKNGEKVALPASSQRASDQTATNLASAKDLAVSGNPKAQLYLGWSYLQGQGVAQDAVEAAKWYRMAADRGNGFAEWVLGGLYMDGVGVPKDAVEATLLIRKAAEQGIAGAQHDLGILYMQGDSVLPQAAGAAYFWLTLAANSGVKDAGHLAECAKHLTPQEVTEAEKKAKDWKPTPKEQPALQKTVVKPPSDDSTATAVSPERKQPPARKVSQDPAKLKAAAEQGDAEAEFNLGLAYEIGQSVPQDQKTAAAWFAKAADQGVAGAQTRLGVLFERGHGVPLDTALAAKWYRRAADQGDAEAQFNLYVLYQEGDGVARDNQEALFWLTLAGKGNPVYTAPSLLSKASMSLTPEQIEAVKKRVAEWKPSPSSPSRP